MTTRRRALLSVSDKTGIESFARALVDRGFELLSTGGTANALRRAGLDVTDVADVTKHPEMMEGRVKTLHPAIHGPLLARRDVPEDLEALSEHGYHPIDVVAVNLYPFRETIARGDVTVAQAMKQVDIGGPTMIRAAAKNHASVWVVVDPGDYHAVVEAIDTNGSGLPFRKRLAQKVFAHISAYDAAVAAFLDRLDAAVGAAEAAEAPTAELPAHLVLDHERLSSLRYGENPDQAAAFYAPSGGARVGIASLEQHHGKELSYNNLLDLDGALLSLAPFAVSPRAAVCIIKHTTPCGLALGDTVEDAFRRALRTDPVSAFGSVIAVNRVVDEAAAGALSELFTECVVAPGFTDGALGVLTQKKNVRLLTFPEPTAAIGDLMLPQAALDALNEASGARKAAAFLAAHGRVPRPLVTRSIYGGLLAQTPPVPPFLGVEPDWKVVTGREPTGAEAADLAFAWAAVFGIKSNAILLAKDGATLGIGAGQMSRVDSSRLAVQKAADAGLDLAGCALASDAFFPFADGVEAAAGAGVRAIVQPGGSIRDEEVIQRANELGLAMVFTGRRLFRH